MKNLEKIQNTAIDINAVLEETGQGRNVVWQTADLADFHRILPSYINRAASLGKKIVSISFSESSRSLEGFKNVQVENIPLTHKFETFTIDVCHKISRANPETFFIFDCLSKLQTAWAADLMIQNFFRVITPLIREKKSRAFFPVLRGMHSQDACQDIRERTDIFLDLYSDFKDLYMRPQKIQNFPPEIACLPYIYDENYHVFGRVVNGRKLSRFLKAVSLGTPKDYDSHKDFWDRYFDAAQQKFTRGQDMKEACQMMCRIMMSRDKQIQAMVQKHFKPTDYFFIREHMIGTGQIGGKACGMLIARKIIENNTPEIFEKFEAHDSFFIGSDVFYSYIVENEFWDLRIKQRTKEGYFRVAKDVYQKLMSGRFSEKMEIEFRKVLNYYGNWPFIVRSSSLLEDGFGNAFAGKYESVFCINTGTMEERLKELEDAIRVVYASTMSRGALDYRLRRGLDGHDEQMALLVMRVSGFRYDNYYLPHAAGMGYSYSTYRFLENLNPSAGMLRLVMGLGTAAVDRKKDSYPRLVSMDKPTATAFQSVEEHHQFCQQNVDVLNCETRMLSSVPLSVLEKHLPFSVKKKLLTHDITGEMRFRERGIRRDILFITCDGIVKNKELMEDMRRLMKTLEEEYHQAVDIEYTINFDSRDQYYINLLQCRPLITYKDTKSGQIPADLKKEDLFIHCEHASMGLSGVICLDYILMIDPSGYYNMPYKEKYMVASLLGKINWEYREKGKKLLLMTPGRIGTSSVELGVPATFSEISEFSAIFEIAESKAGYNPELSYGSHIFQDLVENEILYGAVLEDEHTRCYAPEKFAGIKNQIIKFGPEGEQLKDVVSFYDVSGLDCRIYHDMIKERLMGTICKKGE